MKSIFFLLFCFFSFVYNAFCQQNFYTYTNPNIITCLEVEGDFFWAGTASGLYKWHKNGSLIAFYNQQNGLAGNYVNSIKKDYITGAIWVATRNGVSKLDGSTWTSYTTANGLSDNYVLSLASDVNGNIWFGTAEHGVSKFDGTTWTNYTSADGLIGDYLVASIACDFQGNVWFGTYQGISKFDGSSWTNHTTNTGGYGNIVSIAIDNMGNKWFSTWGNGVLRYDNMNWTTYTTADGLANNAIYSIKIDAQGLVWFGSFYYGVSSYNGSAFNTYTTFNGLANNTVFSITVDAQGTKWFGTENGISRFDGSQWTTYNLAGGLCNNRVNTCAIDSYGNKWFGTDGGISKLNGNTWTTYLPLGMYGSVYDIAIDNQNIKWCGFSGGVAVFNEPNWVFYTVDSGLVHQQVMAVAIDQQGNKWFGTTSGVSKFDGNTWTTYTTVDGLADNNINTIYVDSQGNIWFGGAMYGLTKFDGTTWTIYTMADGLPSNSIKKIVEDSDGNMWFATMNGVSEYNGTLWTNYNVADGLGNYFVNSLAIDNYGIMWFGTHLGISKFDGTNWATYNTVNGLSDNVIYDIEVDQQNNKWVCSPGGGVIKVSCEAPVADFSNDTICESELHSFINLSTKTDIFTKHLWDIYNDGTTELISQSISYSFSSANTYYIKLTEINETCTTEVVKPIVVNSYPDVTIFPQGNTEICMGNSVVLTSVINNYEQGNSYSYTWSNGSASPEITVYTTGNYSLIVSNENCIEEAVNSIDVFMQEPFQNEEICIVTVDTITWKNKIMWENTPGVGTVGYNVYKEVATNYYTNIGFVPYTDPSYLIDYASQPESYGNRYKITAMDSCLNESDKSFYHNTMNLTLSAFGSTMGLTWTPYVDQSGNFIPSMYYIYRGSSPATMALFDSIPGTQTSYNDNNVFSLFYYLVGVKRDTPCNLNGIRNSFSNKKDNATIVGMYNTEMLSGTILISPNPMSTSATLTIPNFEARNPKHESGISSDFEFRISDLTGKVVRVVSPSSILREPQDDSGVVVIERGDLKPGIYFVELNAGRMYRGKLVVE